MLPGEHAAPVDEIQRRVAFSRTRLEQPLGVGGTQPDQQAVVGRQPVDKVLQTGEGEVRHLAQRGRAQQSTYNDVIRRLLSATSSSSSSSFV